MSPRRRTRRDFGALRKLSSGRWQASFVDPTGTRQKAPVTFETRAEGDAWLATKRADLLRGEWLPGRPSKGKSSIFGTYADDWLAKRAGLKPRTREHYRSLLDKQLLPTFGHVALNAISAEMVAAWHKGEGAKTPPTPTLTSHAYGLLRTVLGTAVEEGRLPANPCHIRGAGVTRRRRRVEPATLDELDVLVEAMPDRYRVMVLLASWCALRFGELAELRRADVDLRHGLIRVRRGVTRVEGEKIVGDPKSAAGKRDVAIPPHLVPLVEAHLREHVEADKLSLLFPAADKVSNVAPSTIYRHFYKARDAAGRADLRFHDLRHTGAVLAAQTGATLAELQERLGHSTPQAALIYQHAAKGRDAAIAAALSAMVEQHRRAE